MRLIRTIAAFATVLATVAACTSSGGVDPSSPAPTVSTVSMPPVSVSSTSSPASTHTGPVKPPTPTIPADVPRTGPNTKAGEKPPLMPLEATQHTADGAKAFAEFFVKTIDWGFATLNGAYSRHYAAKTCTSCAGFSDGVDEIRQKNHRYFGGRITVRASSLASKPEVDGASETVIVRFDILSFEETTHSGKFVKGDAAHTGETFSVSLAWGADAWVVRYLSVAA